MERYEKMTHFKYGKYEKMPSGPTVKRKGWLKGYVKLIYVPDYNSSFVFSLGYSRDCCNSIQLLGTKYLSFGPTRSSPEPIQRSL